MSGGDNRRRRRLVGDTPPGDLDSWPDADLVRLAQIRSEAAIAVALSAFKVLYHRYVTEVVNTVYVCLLRSFCRADQNLAEQLTHEAFLKAWNALPEKKAEAPFI